MMRTYRTPKGTELPLLNLRGKEYLEVKYRLVWFREDHPDWAIETDLLSVTENNAYARATIKDETGRIIATSHKYEDRKGFPDFIEKSETGAIGRALALIGYGTQFCADELDEGARVVDAPAEPAKRFQAATAPNQLMKEDPFGIDDDDDGKVRKAPPRVREADAGGAQGQMPKDPGDYQITFGKKYKGLKLRDIPRNELEGYMDWLEENASKKGMPLSEEARFLKVAVERFLQGGETPKASGVSAGGKPTQKASAARKEAAEAKH